MIITIGREFGSGGRYIGERLSKELGLEFYDKEIVEKVSKKMNMDIGVLNDVDEKHKSSFWYSMALSAMTPAACVSTPMTLSVDDKYFIEMARTIEEIAKDNNCVIIGRCSNVILRNNPDAVHIFIYSSDDEFKIKRKVEFSGIREEDAKKRLEKEDAMRAKYYTYYTDEKWGDRESYDLMIDTSKIGIENAINLVKYYVKQEMITKKRPLKTRSRIAQILESLKEKLINKGK